MDKIVKSLLLLSLFIISCTKKTDYDENLNNIKVVIKKHITIDLEKQKLSLDYYGLKYDDTIVFSKSEKKDITIFFKEFDLDNKRGEFWYIDENSNSASLHDEIIIFKSNKIKSRSVINSEYKIKNYLFENEEIKTVKFRNLIKHIIIQKESYNKAVDSLRVFIKRKPVWLM